MMHWYIFGGVFLALVMFDLWAASDKPSLLGAALKTGLNAVVAACFAGYILWEQGSHKAMEFVTGYTLEMSLSFDNVFVISLIMTGMAVPTMHRAKILLLGIAGAIILRGIFIGTGSLLVSEFRWVLVGFAFFLIWTGAKMLISSTDDEEPDVRNSKTLRFLRRFLPMTQDYHGGRFFVGWAMTPLFAALIMIELADIMFAVDSIPAIFAITTDPFVVFTSNMFAVASLRSLFFVLEAMVQRFEKLSIALSAVLIFIGAKVLAAELFGRHIPVPIALGAVLGILVIGIGWSLFSTRRKHGNNEA